MVTLDVFEPKGEMGYFCYSHFCPWDLEKCPDDELPEQLSILRLVRDTYQGNLQLSGLLYWYSHFGKHAYQRLYGSVHHQKQAQPSDKTEC